jgi:hypothetical protein
LVEYAAEPVKLDEKYEGKLVDVPQTGVELIECPVTGSPKPKTSPHYPDFKALKHQQKLKSAERNDTAWLLIRHFNRKSHGPFPEGNRVGDQLPGSVTTSKQSVHVWAAYNSLVASSTQINQQVYKVHALPLVNAPPQQWNTLVTSLTQLYKVNMWTRRPDSTKLMCVWLDMDLYKRVLKLAYLHPELYKDKWIESPGQFHISVCALRCLGQTVIDSGLDDMLVDADIYSNVTVMQILNGKHYTSSHIGGTLRSLV